MSERIDHKAEAERLLAVNSPDAEARAQVHATLALVEQQRVANLLAVHFSREKYGDIEGASELWNNHIRPALGLGE